MPASQTDRQTDRQTGTDRELERNMADRQTGRQTDRQVQTPERKSEQTDKRLNPEHPLLYLFIFLPRFDARTVAVATQLYQLSSSSSSPSPSPSSSSSSASSRSNKAQHGRSADAKPPFHDDMLSSRRDSNLQLSMFLGSSPLSLVLPSAPPPSEP